MADFHPASRRFFFAIFFIVMTPEQQRYVLTQDTYGVFRQLDRSFTPETDQQFVEACEAYFDRMQAELQQVLGDGIEVAGFQAQEIERRLVERVVPLLQEDPGSICICLDRFLLSTLESIPELNERLVRFGICRNVAGDNLPRPGMAEFPDQIAAIHARFPDIQDRKVILVDDGLFSGKTIGRVRELFSNNGDALTISTIIGFIGNMSGVDPAMKEAAVVLQPEEALMDWIDIRDLGPLGGRLVERSKAGRVTTSMPYLFPWSDGSAASLQNSPDFFRISLSLIGEFKTLMQAYEQSARGGQPLRVQDMVAAGLPIPTDAGKAIPIYLKEPLTAYLARCEERIRWEQQREVIVFDMDGTLYQLNGGNGFAGSRLEQAVLERAQEFILMREGCSPDQARAVMEEGLADQVGLSNYLARRYGISRQEYFEYAWDIDPTGILEQETYARAVIERIMQQKPEAKLVLLTSAARVWAERVLETLGVADYFEETYTGERYRLKQDVFQILAGRYYPGNVLSIGDQFETDIAPALALGLQARQVRSPEELAVLFT